MIRLALILAVLLLAGCGDFRPVNPDPDAGADGWLLYLGDDVFDAWYPGWQAAAVCDYEHRRIVARGHDTPDVREAWRNAIHEVGDHMIGRFYPDSWRVIALFNSPTFNVISHGRPPEPAIPPPRLLN